MSPALVIFSHGAVQKVRTLEKGGGDAQKVHEKVQERGGALRRTYVRSEVLNGN